MTPVDIILLIVCCIILPLLGCRAIYYYFYSRRKSVNSINEGLFDILDSYSKLNTPNTSPPIQGQRGTSGYNVDAEQIKKDKSLILSKLHPLLKLIVSELKIPFERKQISDPLTGCTYYIEYLTEYPTEKDLYTDVVLVYLTFTRLIEHNVYPTKDVLIELNRIYKKFKKMSIQ